MVTDGNTAMPAMAVRMHMAEQNGASLFAVKEITGGPSTAALVNFARAQSRNGYDLLTSNCQHYANNVLEFASGKGLTYLPNADSLALSSLLLPPTPVVPFSHAGVLGTVAHEAASAPGRVAVSLAVAACPRDPPSLERVALPQELQQLPLNELQDHLQQMSLWQRERLDPEQLARLA